MKKYIVSISLTMVFAVPNLIAQEAGDNSKEKISANKKIDKWAPKKKEEEGYYSFVNKYQQADQAQSQVQDQTSTTSTIPSNPAQENINNSAASISLAAPQASESKLFAWKATKGSKTIYLVGTIHLLSKDFYPLPKEIEKIFLDSPILVVELANPNIDMGKIDKNYKDKCIFSSGDHLSLHLSPETKKTLNDYLNWSGETLSMYESYKPGFVGGIIRGQQMGGEGYRYGLGLDRYFISRAKELGKKIAQLETPEFQLGLVADKNNIDQDKELRLTLLSFQNDGKYLQEFEKAWKEGDAVQMENLATKEAREHPELSDSYDKVINKRNISMAQKLEELIANDDVCLVAVGSAHMVGQQGIPELLKSKGYAVEQLKVGCFPPAKTLDTKIGRMKQFQFSDSKFSAMFPTRPEKTTGQQGSIYETIYTSNDFQGSYSVITFFLPGRVADAQGLFNKLEGPMFSKMGAKVNSKAAVQLKGYPGRKSEFTIIHEKQSQYGRSFIYIVGPRIYWLCALGTKPWLNSPAVAQFFQSFSVTPDAHTKDF